MLRPNRLSGRPLRRAWQAGRRCAESRAARHSMGRLSETGSAGTVCLTPRPLPRAGEGDLRTLPFSRDVEREGRGWDEARRARCRLCRVSERRLAPPPHPAPRRRIVRTVVRVSAVVAQATCSARTTPLPPQLHIGYALVSTRVDARCPPCSASMGGELLLGKGSTSAGVRGMLVRLYGAQRPSGLLGRQSRLPPASARSLTSDWIRRRFPSGSTGGISLPVPSANGGAGRTRIWCKD